MKRTKKKEKRKGKRKKRKTRKKRRKRGETEAGVLTGNRPDQVPEFPFTSPPLEGGPTSLKEIQFEKAIRFEKPIQDPI